MNEKEKKHARIKLGLKIAGIALTAGGAVLSAVGFISFFGAFGGDGFPDLFWCCFLGLPMFAFGINFLRAGFRREIASYAKNESVPVINEAAEEMTPAVQAIAGAVRGGKGEGLTCPACGKANDAAAKFCDNCGEPLRRICPACGKENDAEAKFCDNCGGKL